jgi:hypothetical protein
MTWELEESSVAVWHSETPGSTAGLPAVIDRNVQAPLGNPAVALEFGNLFRTRSLLRGGAGFVIRWHTQIHQRAAQDGRCRGGCDAASEMIRA